MRPIVPEDGPALQAFHMGPSETSIYLRFFTFKAKQWPIVGSYRARNVFPKAGRYSLGVYDGFPVAECARVHTFKPVVIAAV